MQVRGINLDVLFTASDDGTGTSREAVGLNTPARDPGHHASHHAAPQPKQRLTSESTTDIDSVRCQLCLLLFAFPHAMCMCCNLPWLGAEPNTVCSVLQRVHRGCFLAFVLTGHLYPRGAAPHTRVCLQDTQSSVIDASVEVIRTLMQTDNIKQMHEMVVREGKVEQAEKLVLGREQAADSVIKRAEQAGALEDKVTALSATNADLKVLNDAERARNEDLARQLAAAQHAIRALKQVAETQARLGSP